MYVDAKIKTITLKILKSENLCNSQHMHVPIEYNCSWRLVISIVIKLNKTLD